MFCREWTVVKHFSTTALAAPMICRCWHCEHCVSIRLRELADLCKRGRPTTFLTLTVNPGRFSSPDERARKLVDSWRLVRQTMRRRFGFKSVPFIAIFEQTEAGEPHLHILARMPYVAQRWLSRYMNKLMGAPVVDIQKVRSQGGVARYVAKYVSKAPRMWEGTKRYWRSLDWLFGEQSRLEKQGPPPRWSEVWRQPVMRVVQTFAALGRGVSFDGFKWTIVQHKEEAQAPPNPPPRPSIRLRSYG